MIVVRFFDVTKPASICDHKKFRNHENDSLQITRPSLIEVLIPLYYSNIRIFFRRIFGGQKFGGEFDNRRRLGGLSPPSPAAAAALVTGVITV